jgi:hypothetical protein
MTNAFSFLAFALLATACNEGDAADVVGAAECIDSNVKAVTRVRCWPGSRSKRHDATSHFALTAKQILYQITTCIHARVRVRVMACVREIADVR